MRQQGFSKARNSQHTKRLHNWLLPLCGLGLGVDSAIACDWIGQQITHRANNVKMGKNKDPKEKVDGRLAGGRKQS